MKKTRKVGLLALVALLLVNCSKEKRYNVPEEVEVYVKRFEDEANARGYDIEIKRLIVDYVDNLVNDGDEIAGRCNNPGRRTPHIELDSDFLNMSPEVQEQLVFHELGHCILERGHRDAFLSNGQFASIMNTKYWTYIEGQDYKRDHYLDELFAESHSDPSWASNPATTYDAISATQRTAVFTDEFDNNANGWGLTNSDGNSITISNGEMQIRSNTTGGLAALKSFTIASGTNYEIEARYKINADLNQTNAIIVDRDNVFSVFGINRNGLGSIGELTDPEDIVSCEPCGVFHSDYNIYTVRKIDDRLYYFINQNLIDYREIGPHTIQSFGLLIGVNAEVDLDWMNVYEINL